MVLDIYPLLLHLFFLRHPKPCGAGEGEKYAKFNWVFSDFYVKQIESNRFIKIVPLNIYESLTAIGLAFWIMVDGSYSKIKGNIILCTDSYTLQEVKLLISVLSNKFNLSCGLIN